MNFTTITQRKNDETRRVNFATYEEAYDAAKWAQMKRYYMIKIVDNRTDPEHVMPVNLYGVKQFILT